MTTPTLTVCVLAKDEEINIARALNSAKPVADELLVVDTGSTDRTVEIALKHGARVIHHPWKDDFAEVRNAGLTEARGDWVLMLDADEAISPELTSELAHALKNPSVEAYILPVENIREDGPHGFSPVLRLFRNRPNYRYSGRLHEQIEQTILAAGGGLATLKAPLEHYGYTAAEDERKNRRSRNIRLLEQSLAEDPTHYSLWYFLGLERVLTNDFGRASDCFSRALSLGSWGDSMHLTYAAHRLAQIELQRQRLDRGRDLAKVGADQDFARWDSHLLVAQVGLLEGDFELALQKVRLLEQASPKDYGSLPRERQVLLQLEAQALWQKGEREKALQVGERGVSRYPGDPALANQWVKQKVIRDGLGRGLNSALQIAPNAQVASACVGALLRAGEFDAAGDLAQKSLNWGFSSVFLVYGIARGGYWELAEQIVSGSGLEGTIHLATAAAWFGQDELLSRALGRLNESWRAAFEAVLTQEPLPEDSLWAADILMAQWAEIGCLPLLDAAARVLPGGLATGTARAAWLAHRAGLTGGALQLALRFPDQPDALEVLGLTAFDNGDTEAAAHFLTRRISMGASSVGIYHKGAEALRRLGNAEFARQVLETGLAHRPQSLLLRQALLTCPRV